jgi:hypothetical protein
MPLPPLSDVRAAAASLVAMLLSFGSAVLLRGAFSLDVSVIILSVSLSVMLARAGQRKAVREQLVSLLVIPAVGVVGALVGYLLLTVPVLGSALFVVGVSGGVWLRRFGPLATRIGTYVSLPFIALLVAPVSVAPSAGSGFVPWAAVIAFAAAAWALLVQLVAQRAGFIEAPRPPVPARVRAEGVRRVLPSTRMAAQLAVALALAFALGHLLLGDHWPWAVITAYVVTSGNRGRGDVLYKGVQRTLGAVVGTALATVLALAFAPGDPWAIALIFVLLGVGTWLRGVSYAWWAGSVTAVLSLLYDYFGVGSSGLLLERIGGVLIGGALAVGCAWFILPLRTRDVLRRRMFDALAALSDVLGAARSAPGELPAASRRFDESLAAVEQLAPTLRAADLILRLRRLEPAHGHVLRSLRDCADPVAVLADAADLPPLKMLGQVARDVGQLRRSLAARTDPVWDPLPNAPDTVNEAAFALLAIDATVRGWR